LRATSAPTIVPITSAKANPLNPRCSVVHAASMFVLKFSTNESHTLRGPGSTYSGFQPLHTTSCHTTSTSTIASSFGHAAAQTRAVRLGPEGRAVSRWSRPDSSRSSSWASALPFSGVFAMTAHLLPQLLGDRRGEVGDGV
jgi:hypothetical protein